MNLHQVSAPIARLWHEIDHALASRATRRELEHRMLKDLGISRAQAAFEAQRLPWHLTKGRH
jgi:uncharacterized protein YjiS (DUF1127 family)